MFWPQISQIWRTGYTSPFLGHNDSVRTRKGKSRMRSVNLTTPQEFRNIFDKNYHYLNVKVACFTFHSLQLYCKTLTLRTKKKRNYCYLLGQIYIKLTLNPSNKLEIILQSCAFRLSGVKPKSKKSQ